MKKLTVHVLILSLLCSMLTGCARVRNKIAYTIYPIGYLIQRLTANTIQYQSIQMRDVIVQNANIADNYQEILESSKVLFHIGTLEPYYTVYESQIKQYVRQDVDLSTVNAVYDFNRYTLVEDEDGNTYYEESPYYEGHEFEIIDVNQKDLSIWIDPITMISMAKDIRDWLVKDNPDQREIYENNFTVLESELIEIDAQYQSFAQLVKNNGQTIRFATMSPSFGNWQKTYGFQIYPICLSKYGVLPTESQLEKIKERLIADDVQYIAYEPNMSEDMIELFHEIEEELGLTRIELSNLSSLSEAESTQGKDYQSIMYENLNVLEMMLES